MLRVCHIISGDLWAGAEVMVYHLLKGLQVYDKLTLSAILLNGGRLAKDLRKLGIRVHLVDENNRPFFNIFLAIRKIFSETPQNVIHSHSYKENTLAYLLSKSFRATRLVSTQHGMPEVYGGDTALRHRFITKLNFFVLSKCFHRVVGVSQDIQEAFVQQHGFRENKVSVIHNGTEIPSTLPMKRIREAFVIGSSGRLFPVKDYPFMIEIAREARKRSDKVRFELAGDGPERPKLQGLIHRYGLKDVFVLKGHVDDISGFYRGLDLYLNTSVHEGIPMSVLEAMSFGLPVIAPKVGGLTEIVDDGLEGYLVEGRNPKAFAEKCLLLYETKALRQQMAEAARQKVVKEFSVVRMAEEYYNLYAALAEST